MALPTSGPISMSMVNIEIGDNFDEQISFESIAADFNLSSPNYGDSIRGFGINELYGLSPSLTAVYSDFGVTTFNLNSQTGLITSPPVATQGSDPVPSLTVDYVGDPFSLVLTNTTRTANIDLTVPAESANGNPYTNSGDTLSGTTTGVQTAYAFEFNDWTGGIGAINPNSGIISFNAGNDNNAPSIVTNNTSFTQGSGTPSAAQFVPSHTKFGIRTGTGVQRTVTFTLGVPGGNQDGGSGAYGNQGSTVSGTDSLFQYPEETLALSITGGGNSLTWTSGQSGTSANKEITTTTGGGDGSVGFTATVLNGHVSQSASSAGLNFDFSISVNSSTGFGFTAGNGSSGIIYVHPSSTNTSLSSRTALVNVQVDNGHREQQILLTQTGNVTFTTNPTGGSSIAFNEDGSLKSGDNTIELTTNPSPYELDWRANVTGSQYSFAVASDPLVLNGTEKEGTGNETFTIVPATNTGGTKTGTLNIDSRHTGVVGVLKTFTLTQDAAAASGTIRYNANTLTQTIGSFGGTITISNVSSGLPSPAYQDIRVVTNYAMSFTADIGSTTYAELDSSSDLSGTPSGGSSSFTGTSITSNTGAVSFYINFKANTTSSDRIFDLDITFDDDHTSSNTTIEITVEGTSGGSPGVSPSVSPSVDVVVSTPDGVDPED